jgi:hypothetical protein
MVDDTWYAIMGIEQCFIAPHTYVTKDIPENCLLYALNTLKISLFPTQTVKKNLNNAKKQQD